MLGRGHSVTLAVPPESSLRDLAQRKGVPVIPITLRTARYVPLVYDFLRVIKRNAVQILNTHGSLDSWTASFAGRLSGQRPLIIRTRHKSTPVRANARHRVLYRRLPHAIVTTGETVRHQLVRGLDLDASRVVSIPTGVDFNLFKLVSPDSQIREGLGLSPEQVVVGCIAFLRGYKGLDCLIEAASQVVHSHPAARFVIVGSGPEEETLRHKIGSLGLSRHVILTGFREDVPALLASMDIVAVPSFEGEGIPQSLTQAMAMERPVVATAVGGIAEVVEHGATGLLVAPRDPQGLAEGLSLLIKDHDLRARLARAGRDRVVESYGLERMLDRTEELYKRLIDDRELRAGHSHDRAGCGVGG